MAWYWWIILRLVLSFPFAMFIGKLIHHNNPIDEDPSDIS